MSNPELILASSSRYRRELLDRLGVDYRTMSPDVDETALEGEAPVELARRLARAKAQAVAAANPGAVVIGSDQVCDLQGCALGKPGTFERAFEQLSPFGTGVDGAGLGRDRLVDYEEPSGVFDDRAVDVDNGVCVVE